MKTSRQQQLQLKADSSGGRGRGRGRGKGRGRGRGASQPNDVPPTGGGKRAGSAAGGKARAKKQRAEDFLTDDQAEFRYEEQWYEEWGEDWDTSGWEEPERKAADAYAWWDGKVSMSQLATPQKHVDPTPADDAAQEPGHGIEKAVKKRSRKQPAEEAAEEPIKPKKSKAATQEAPVDAAPVEEEPMKPRKGKKEKAAKEHPAEVEEAEGEQDPPEHVSKKAKQERGGTGKSKKEVKEKLQKENVPDAAGKKQKRAQEMPIRRTVPHTTAKQVKVLMNFAHLFAADAERDDVKMRLLPNLTPTIMCTMQNFYWKRPGFGVKSNNDLKDIAYFKFNWDPESPHDSNGEYAWRAMASVAFKCADIFAAWKAKSPFMHSP